MRFKMFLSPEGDGSGGGEPAGGGWASGDYAGPTLSKGTPAAGTYDSLDESSADSAGFAAGLAAVAKGEEPPAGAPAKKPEEQQEAKPGEEAAKPKTEPGQRRTVTTTDESGRRVKVSYDPNDVERMDKIVAEAAGFRKMQAERDRFRGEAQSVGALKESAGNWNKFEETFAQFGPEGVMDRVLGGDGTGSKLKEYQAKKYEERLKLEEMTPSERARHEVAEQLAAERRAREISEKRMNDLLTKNEQRQNELDIRAVQQEVAPFAQKYSLEGKLGSPNLERVLNKQIQEMAYGEIEKVAAGLPPDADIPAHIVDRAFRRAKDFYSRDIDGLIQGRAKDSQAQSRVKAQEAAAAAVGVRTSSSGGSGAQGAQSAKSSFSEMLSSALGWKR